METDTEAAAPAPVSEEPSSTASTAPEPVQEAAPTEAKDDA